MFRKKILHWLIMGSILLNLFFVNNWINHNKEIQLLSTRPTKQITSITTIKPEVKEIIKVVYVDKINPLTNVKKTGNKEKDLLILENTIPKIQLDAIEIIQTKDNIYVPNKIGGILDYGYNRHYLELKLNTKIKKPYTLNIKAVTLWNMGERKLIHDYQLSWEWLKYNEIGINIGLGLKEVSLTSSWDIIGNLDFHAGCSYLYGKGFGPSFGLSLDIF